MICTSDKDADIAIGSINHRSYVGYRWNTHRAVHTESNLTHNSCGVRQGRGRRIIFNSDADRDLNKCFNEWVFIMRHAHDLAGPAGTTLPRGAPAHCALSSPPWLIARA